MALSLKRGRVTAVVERASGLTRIEVDGVPCIAYPEVTGPVALEDEVVVNVQARELELGTGGFDVLYVNLTRGLGLVPERDAHVMKLPYTPGQFAKRHAEEDGIAAEALDGMPVVGCSLHSQVVPVCAALSGLRVAYVQIPGGALPVAFSDSVRALRNRELIAATASVGPCFGGDAECVTVYSALLWAKAFGADVAVCAIGPGIVGTASPFGHGGMAVVEALHAAAQLGGVPIVAARVSDADPRERHRGLSHHTRAIASVLPAKAVIARPEDVDVDGWREACAGLPLSHMGRGPDEDPAFFKAAFAAGRLARTRAG
jgi:Protein of unknown function (DUF3866)